ncbi:iron-containing redox enzyme family protein [Sporichthya sp.]|uniref:iron-containing redox enzyme family protein n=1 Tax=Sporichthya sp. TaxID=65475 RepID=UPI0017D5E31C|nr:iron-containing redox enzyme family protein [Sporichthya sp.]MBA3744911.1 iron-containing redox enzyme family protein [Sporichthya sp.]
MTVTLLAGRSEALGPPLPEPRGPLSMHMHALILAREGYSSPAAVSTANPFGDDLHLALYTAYELHYRGFAGVSDDQEWDPHVLALRTALERRFLGALRDELGPVDEDVDAAIAELLLVDGEGGVAAYLARNGTREQLREVLAHRSMYHLKEADPQAFVLPRLHGATKAGVAAVEFDEYGGGHAARMHAQLFAELMAAFDLDTRYGAYVEIVPAPMLAMVNFMSLCGLHRSRRGALLGQLAAVEITSPPGSMRMVAAVRRTGGDADAEDFYAEHVVADCVHEQVMRRDVIGNLLAGEPHLAADVVFGIRAAGLLDTRLDEHLLSSWEAGRSSLCAPLPA